MESQKFISHDLLGFEVEKSVSAAFLLTVFTRPFLEEIRTDPRSLQLHK